MNSIPLPHQGSAQTRSHPGKPRRWPQGRVVLLPDGSGCAASSWAFVEVATAHACLGSWDLEKVELMVGFCLSPDPELATASLPWTPDSLQLPTPLSAERARPESGRERDSCPSLLTSPLISSCCELPAGPWGLRPLPWAPLTPTLRHLHMRFNSCA